MKFTRQHFLPRISRLASAIALGLGIAYPVCAATYYWDGNSTSWNVSTDWSANSDGSGTGAIPGSSDTAYFSASTVATSQTVTLDANQSVLGLTFAAPANFNLTINSGTGGPNSLTIGTGGINYSNTGCTLAINSNLVVNGNQTWGSSGSAFDITGAISGTGNITFGSHPTTSGDSLGNVTGIAFLTTAGADITGNFLNTFSGGVSAAGGNVGLQGSAFTDTHALAFTGSTNWYNNGVNSTYSGAVTGAFTMSLLGGGTTTFSGTTNNAGLTVTTATSAGTTYLNKTSSSSVHAVGGSLNIGQTSTVQITGTGGDQIADTGSVSIGTGGIFDLNGNSETINALTGTGTVTNTASSTASTLTVGGGNGGGTFSGVLQDGNGSLSFTKIGTGTETLTAANTYTGTTTVSGGNGGANLTGGLTLDFSASSPATILSSSSALALGNSTFTVKGAASGTSSQTVNGLTLNTGASAIVLNSNGGSGTNLSLGAITRSTGGTLAFTLPTTGNISTASANANFTGGQQTILGGYAVVGGNTWAVSGSGATPGNITGLATYNPGFAAGTDVDVAAGTSTPAAMTVNSIRFNTVGVASVSTSGNLVVATGGILNTAAVAGNATSINNNTITSGNGQDLIVTQNNNNGGGTLTIGSAIVDNASTSIGLTKSGVGGLTLTGANTYTGPTNLNGGTTTVTAASTLGSGSAVNLKGASTTLAFTNPNSVALPSAASAWASSSDWRGTPNNLGNGVSYQVGANGGGSAQPDFILVDLGKNYALNQASFTINNTYQVMQYFTANSSVGSFSSLFTAPNSTNDGTSAQPNTLNLSDFTADSAVFGTNGTNGPTGAQTFTLSGVSGEYFAFYITSRVSNNYGLDLQNLVLTQTVGASVQTIGSLSSAESTSSVALDTLVTLNTGSNNSSTTFAGVISGAGNLVKAGAGTMTLSGTNTYSGTTTVNGGTLSLAKAGTISGTTITGGTLSAAGTAVTVNSSGTLLLSASNAMAPSSAITLNSGTFSVASGVLQGQGATLTGGTASGTSVTGLGALTLTANSTLNFLGTSGTVVHSSFAPGTFTLNVTGTNFGTSAASADGSTDRLIFDADESANLSDFRFNGASGASELSLGSGFYEIVPAAVPEPATWAAGLLTLLTIPVARRRIA